MVQSRTHTCGELRLSDAGKTVTLVGWMENIREVGSNFAFVVLRDFYGTTQVVIENEAIFGFPHPVKHADSVCTTERRTAAKESERTSFASISPSAPVTAARHRAEYPTAVPISNTRFLGRSDAADSSIVSADGAMMS